MLKGGNGNDIPCRERPQKLRFIVNQNVKKMKQQEYILLSSPHCSPCIIVKHFLEEMYIPFRYIQFTSFSQAEEDEEIAKLVKESGYKKVPQLFTSEGEFVAIGGPNILEELTRDLSEEEKERAKEVYMSGREKVGEHFQKRMKKLREERIDIEEK